MARREFTKPVRVEIVKRATKAGVRAPFAYKRPEYRHWINMKSRCTNPNTPGFQHWGGRGIKVCERWLNSFDAFFSDVGPRPDADHSLDRFPDTNGNYEPGNVRWATRMQQARNTTKNSLICLGDEILSVAEAAERVGVKANTIIYRLRRGWTPSDALDPGNFQGQRI